MNLLPSGITILVSWDALPSCDGLDWLKFAVSHIGESRSFNLESLSPAEAAALGYRVDFMDAVFHLVLQLVVAGFTAANPAIADPPS